MPTPAAYLHRNVSLLEVSDPAILDQLYADRKTVDFLLARISDRVAVVDSEKLEALYARLRKLEHMPKMVTTLS